MPENNLGPISARASAGKVMTTKLGCFLCDFVCSHWLRTTICQTKDVNMTSDIILAALRMMILMAKCKTAVSPVKYTDVGYAVAGENDGVGGVGDIMR